MKRELVLRISGYAPLACSISSPHIDCGNPEVMAAHRQDELLTGGKLLRVNRRVESDVRGARLDAQAAFRHHVF
jgi:hypothetical protein